MRDHHILRLVIHAFALFVEALGTFFIWLDTARINARLPQGGIMFGDAKGYEAWYHHSALLGFSLLGSGILLAGVCLWIEHRAHIKK